MGCGIAIVKYLVFVFNLIFAIIGLALIIIGVVWHVNITAFTKTFNEGLQVAPTCLIVVGVLIFIISFFGCCGAIKESNCMLISYAIFLIVILVVQMIIGILAFLAIRESEAINIRADINNDMQDMFNKYNATEEDKSDFDGVQQLLKCCGVESPSDWKTAIPPSCCKDESARCGYGDDTLFKTGCTTKSYDLIMKIVRSVGYVVFGICAAEIIGVMFAFCLTNSIKNQYRRGAYA